jgi:uncharacterized protein YukJ
VPIANYGVLRGKTIAARRENDENSPHYQVQVLADDTDFRLAINVKSQLAPSELLFLVAQDFRHPMLDQLPSVAVGFTELARAVGGLALDFIRGNLFDRTALRALPHNLPGPANDLNDQVEHFVARAIAEPDAEVYAFGSRWGPEPGRDKIFGFRPGNGVHNIHMNQGNHARFMEDDGVWQDGAVLFHFPSQNQWVAVFLAFQSQAWHTDDQTGHQLPEAGPEEPDLIVRIVAALVNPTGPAPEPETVTLINTSNERISLEGWSILDRLEHGFPLVGTIEPGHTHLVRLTAPVQLGNSGGVITLVNAQGLKVHGVSYTKQQSHREGWTLVF